MPGRRSSNCHASLSHGADVNTIDVQHSGVVGHAADGSYATCVHLLLEAGADPDIASAHGYRVGNPLNIAARNAAHPLVLKTLLDLRANVHSCGLDGMTGLIHASRRDNASSATLLLEYGANINATSAARQTPPTTAVSCNSHNVPRLLLERWFDYCECPRRTGPHLLQLVALYADIETISILRNIDHLHLKCDSAYALGGLISRLSERSDVTEKLMLAFEELMGVIKIGPAPPSRHGTENLMESGSAHSEASDSDGEMFENATESLYLEKMSLQKRATAEQLPIRKRDLLTEVPVDIFLDISKCDAALLCACFNHRPYEYDYRNM